MSELKGFGETFLTFSAIHIFFYPTSTGYSLL